MMVNVAPMILVGTIGLVAGTVFHVVGTLTSKWTSSSIPNRPDYRHGLFRECFDGGCRQIDEDNFRYNYDALQSVAAFAVIGVIASILVSLVSIVSLFLLTGRRLSYKAKRILVAIILFVVLVAATCIFLAIIIFGTTVYPDDNSFHTHLSTSFVFCVVGVVLLVVGEAIFLIGSFFVLKEHTKQEKYEAENSQEFNASQTNDVIMVPRS